MNILFSFTYKNTFQRVDCCAIADIVQNDNNKLMILSGSTAIKNESCLDNYAVYSANEHTHIDCVIAYTKTGLQQIKELATTKQLPIVYVVNAQEFENEYYADISIIDRLVVFGNTENTPMFLIRKDLTHTVGLLPAHCETPIRMEKEKEEKKRLLIDISSFNLCYLPVYKLISFLNILVNFDVTIVYDQKNLLPFLNTNIKLLPRNQVDISTLLSECDIIMGSGDIIYHGISNKKPCIVVGEQGYGGIISPQNLLAQQSNHFQGRIGGYLGEYIPENLLQDDLQTLMNLDDEKQNELVENNKNILDEIYRNTKQQWQTIIGNTVERHKKVTQNLLDCTLCLSSDLLLVAFPDDKFVITHAVSRQVHSNFGKAEADIIALFKEPKTVKAALDESGYKDDVEIFTEFVQLLVNEKIVMYHEQ